MGITAETRRAGQAAVAPKKPKRSQQIVEAVLAHGPMTAEELMDCLGYSDPNAVRPRLTELKQANVLVPIGKRRSHRTGVTTAVWGLRDPAERS